MIFSALVVVLALAGLCGLPVLYSHYLSLPPCGRCNERMWDGNNHTCPDDERPNDPSQRKAFP